ncbi:baseplate J/gp47 family protein [Idiomarina abyssalis]|uniref:baseplate J/gp47 family protein n=1 Tax=Idiomarina abyssalis TaxID=86102 RepID=UPI001CD6CBFF|nr:baseplate J/gp47 family protein [Idiomarina abyssalis]
MSLFELIDMSRVPVPDIIEKPSFEEKFSELKALTVSLHPEAKPTLELESEPLTKMLQAFAYRELHLIAFFNDGTRANMLASATKNDLTALASRYNIERLTVQEEDNSVTPPAPAVMEDDEALRRRTQMAFDGLNTAGSNDAYVFYALGSDGRVLDAYATSPAPCEMNVYILSHEGTGSPSQNLIEKVRATFGLTPDGLSQLPEASKVRPQGDRVRVLPATIVDYEIQAEVFIKPGPDAQVVFSKAQAALNKYIKENHKLGNDITRSGVFAALHQPGTHNVQVTKPASDLAIDKTQAANCTSVNVTLGGISE